MHYYISQIIFIGLLLMLSALFSASETALFSLKKSQIHRFSHSRKTSELRVYDMMRNPTSILMTILTGNLLVNILMSSISTSILLGVSERYGHLLAIAVLTPIIVVLGEITPKVIALSNPEFFSRFLSPPLNLFHGLLYPVRLLFSLLAKPVIKITGFRPKPLAVTHEEIEYEIAETELKKIITEDEADFIRNIMKFPDKEAYNIMIPRNHAVLISENATIEEAMDIFRETGVVRAPVFRGNADSIVGLLDSREIILLSFSAVKRKKKIKSYVRGINFYPASKKIGDLLKEFLSKRIQIAVTVDEYGGTAGIVTLSSLIIEILGKGFSLADGEHSLEIRETGKDRFIVDAEIQLDDFNDYFDEKMESSESDTLAGFIIENAGHFPSRDFITETEKLKMRVRSIRKNRIETCEIIRKEVKP